MLFSPLAKAAIESRMEQLEKDHQELLNENISITENSQSLNNDLRKQLASLRIELQEAVAMREQAMEAKKTAEDMLKNQVDLAKEVREGKVLCYRISGYGFIRLLQ